MGALATVGKSISTAAASGKLRIKNASPEILVGVGIVGVIGATVMACKATLKCDEILECMDEELERVEKAKEIAEERGMSYTEEDVRKDTINVYAKGGTRLIKLYGPSALLMALSITSILCGHKILKKRNLALTAAYGVVSESFNKYRERVKASLGDERDEEFLHGLKEEIIGTETYTDENGKTKKEKVKGYTSPDGLSLYSKFFDESCDGWEQDPYYNETFLIHKQAEANRTLKQRGYLTLNDVYAMLDIPGTEAGFVVGWIYDPHYIKEDHNFEDQVDFRIFNPRNSRAINGVEPVYLLDFNVQGTIYDRVPNQLSI